MKKILTVILVTVAVGILHAQKTAKPSMDGTARSPNIIFILADDLGYGDLGCYGQPRIDTPHLDRMAEEGIRFTEVYSGYTVCAPSRSVLMTGKHWGNTRVKSNGSPG